MKTTLTNFSACDLMVLQSDTKQIVAISGRSNQTRASHARKLSRSYHSLAADYRSGDKVCALVWPGLLDTKRAERKVMALIKPEKTTVQVLVTLTPAQVKIITQFRDSYMGDETRFEVLANQVFRIFCLNPSSLKINLARIFAYWESEDVASAKDVATLQQDIIRARIEDAAKGVWYE